MSEAYGYADDWAGDPDDEIDDGYCGCSECWARACSGEHEFHREDR